MPKGRSPNRDKAREIWLDNTNISLKEIAAQLEESEGIIRKWKCVDKWERPKGNVTKQSKDKNGNVTKKQGAPKGNKNAEGHGAPIGNTNAYKHGGYSSIIFDSLDDVEKELVSDMPQDEELQLIDQIKILTVRERRLMTAIKKYRDIEAGQAISGTLIWKESPEVIKEVEPQYRELVKEKQGDKRISYFYNKRNISTTTESTYNIVLRLEKELSTIQKQKTKTIETLSRIRRERAALNGSGSKEIVDAWVTAVTEADEHDKE